MTKLRFVAALAVLFTFGCNAKVLDVGDPNVEDGPIPEASKGTDAPSDAASCSTDPRVQQLTAGLVATSSSGFGVEIVSAAPPARGMNSWTVKLTQNGTPYTGAVSTTLFMPEHGHGSSVVPRWTPNADGTQSSDNLYLFMGGVWQVSFAPDGSTCAPRQDSQETQGACATYTVCVR